MSIRVAGWNSRHVLMLRTSPSGYRQALATRICPPERRGTSRSPGGTRPSGRRGAADSHEYSGCGVEFGSRSLGGNGPLRLSQRSCFSHLPQMPRTSAGEEMLATICPPERANPTGSSGTSRSPEGTRPSAPRLRRG